MNHVAYLIPTIDRIGGAEQQVIQLAAAFEKRDWQTSVIALSGTGGNTAELLRSHGVSYSSLAMRKGLADPRGWIHLRRWIKREKPDVLHAHLPHAALMARWSRYAFSMPVVLDTIHSPATGNLLRKLGYRISRNLPDLVTAVSRAAAEPWLAANLLNTAKFRQIPNCVDLNTWKWDDSVRRAIRREMRIDNDFVWIAAGRLEPVKDYETLLRAMVRLPHNSQLIIAGSGALDRDLRSLADNLGLGARIRFLGFEPNLIRWMQAADCLVLSSRWEGLPMALLEACACELPAVVTDVPGSREILQDPCYRFIAPVGSADCLATAMISMMDLPESERRQLGRRLRQSVANKFSLDTVIQQWDTVYRELIEKNRSLRARSVRFSN